jgi:hypothetical protein
MNFDSTTIVIIVIAVLMVIWLVGLVRKIGGCLIHLALLGAGAVLIYAIYTGRIVVPL